MDAFNHFKNLMPSLNGTGDFIPGKRALGVCAFVSVTALASFALIMFGTGIGIQCEARQGADPQFQQGLCHNRLGLLVDMGCFHKPNRTAMRGLDLSPADFGSYRCLWDKAHAWKALSKENKKRLMASRTVQYWQHGWNVSYLLLVGVLMSAPSLLWSSFERGVSKGLTGAKENPGLVMRRSPDYWELNSRIQDVLLTGRARSYVARYILTVLFALALQAAIFEATVAFLPGTGFRTYGYDMAMWLMDDSPSAALDLEPYTDAELEAASGPLPPFLGLFPPAGICKANVFGPSGTSQNLDIRCFFLGARYTPGVYLVLWYAFVLNMAALLAVLAKMLAMFIWLPTGWILRRLSLEWSVQGTEMESRRVRELLYHLSFTQFMFLDLICDLCEPQAYADLLVSAHATLGV